MSNETPEVPEVETPEVDPAIDPSETPDEEFGDSEPDDAIDESD